MYLVLIAFLFFNCSSTVLKKSWKNPDYATFVPKNILVIGVTPNTDARKDFEFQLVKELNALHVNALQSHVVFETSFQDSKKTKSEIEAQLNKLVTAGYDAILISVVKGVENNKSYSGKSSKLDYRLRKFIGYYFTYQDAYFNPQYFDAYNVFTIETSLYSLHISSNKSRIWYGRYDMVDQNNVQKSINSYVKAVIKTLKKEELILKK
jgi:hypothetical protein